MPIRKSSQPSPVLIESLEARECFSVSAYDAGFLGGVNVAVADVNRDVPSLDITSRPGSGVLKTTLGDGSVRYISISPARL